MKNINEAKSMLIVRKVVIDKLNFERFSDDIEKVDDKGQITFHNNIQKIEEYVYKVTLGVNITSAGQYDISVQISGIFEISEESILAKKILTNNTIAILFPYLRSQLTLLTSQPGFEPIILPIMNINALMKDE